MSKQTANEFAAEWMASRFLVSEKREEFKKSLLSRLPEFGDWKLYNDYDPDGILLDAVRDVDECRGYFFSGDSFFPRKTGIWKIGNQLYAKEGYRNFTGSIFTEVLDAESEFEKRKKWLQRERERLALDK